MCIQYVPTCSYMYTYLGEVVHTPCTVEHFMYCNYMYIIIHHTCSYSLWMPFRSICICTSFLDPEGLQWDKLRVELRTKDAKAFLSVLKERNSPVRSTVGNLHFFFHTQRKKSPITGDQTHGFPFQAHTIYHTIYSERNLLLIMWRCVTLIMLTAK